MCSSDLKELEQYPPPDDYTVTGYSKIRFNRHITPNNSRITVKELEQYPPPDDYTVTGYSHRGIPLGFVENNEQDFPGVTSRRRVGYGYRCGYGCGYGYW